MKRHRKNNLLPTYVISSVLKITPRLCKELGIEAMLLDIDNTLTTHNNPEPYIGLFRWIDRLQDAGVELIIFSNNNHRRVANFARRLDLPYVARAAKPLPISCLPIFSAQTLRIFTASSSPPLRRSMGGFSG